MALENKQEELFTNFLMQFQCVVFSRTSPKQKVKIVRLLKRKNI